MSLSSEIRKHPHHLLFILFPLLFFGFGLFVLAQSVATQNTNYCSDGAGGYRCKYLGRQGSTFSGTPQDVATVRIGGEIYQAKNNSGRDLFVPYGTPAESGAFVKAAKRTSNPLGVKLCKVGEYDHDNFVVNSENISGCTNQAVEDANTKCKWGGTDYIADKTLEFDLDALGGNPYTAVGPEVGCCEVTTNNGQRCRVKSGTTSWSVVNQKRWHDGSAFEWSSGQLGGSASQRYLWQSKSNSSRMACQGDNDHNKYAWDPNGPGGKWARYRCYVDHSYCFWGWCGERWDHVSTTSQNPYIRTYTSSSISGNQTYYGEQCTEAYYRFSGTYESQCYNDGNGDQNGQVNNWDPLAKKALATLLPPDGGPAGLYPCTQSCSDYNGWSKLGTEPYHNASCGSLGYNQTRIGACGKSCYGSSSCPSGDSNCEMYDDGSTYRTYNQFCSYAAFNWSTGSYGACSFSSGYRSGSNHVTGAVRKYRPVQCKTPRDALVDYNRCNPDDRPDSTGYCDTSNTRYYWLQDSDYSGCTAQCERLTPTQVDPSKPESIFAGLMTARVANAEDAFNKLLGPIGGDICPTGQTTITKYGTEYKESQCRKVVGNVDTLAPDSECTGVGGLSAAYRPSRSCQRNCPCTDGGGLQ